MYRNAATYLSMVAAKRYGFSRGVYYDLVGWNGLGRVPEDDKNRVAILHLAEMCDFYSRGMAEYYQLEPRARKLFNIVEERQFKKLVSDLEAGYKAEYGE